MAQRGGRRKADVARRSRLGPTAAAVGIAVACTLVAGGVVAAVDDEPGVRRTAAEPGSGAPATPTTPATPATPAPVVPGLHFEKRELNARQLTVKMRKRGLVPLTGRPTEETTFRVSSFNVLGASHTSGKDARKGFGGYDGRLRAAVGLLRAHDISVVGLQEFQDPQAALFASIAGEYSVFPGLAGSHLDVENSIAWREADWELVDARTSQIPYFGGQLRNMPHVLLRHRDTGREIWFGNYHNPADTHGGAQHWRDRAKALQAALVEELTADGTPMIITGDLNEREGIACGFTRMAGMHASDGSYYGSDGCHPASGLDVDWVLGTSEIDFSGHVYDTSVQSRRISDHAMLRTAATVTPAADAPGCVRKVATGGPEKVALWFCPE